ncbi:MAG: iron-containing alcohol dehydrogenase [Gracilibacteraceae bacterium]|jgi:alcohol dehydrogenase YqhD (iron-dependent ADH family)|nr:iron-containing alcohol dehydrogenase [Gracilibacteraceae bacterium]
MENFTYAIGTRSYFGEGQIKNLGRNIRQYCARVLLVYGQGSIKRNGVYDAVIEELGKSGINFAELPGIEPNAKLPDVIEGVRLCRLHQVGGVLAVGGGSVLDCAKTIAGCVAYEGDPWDLISMQVRYTKFLPIFTVLTLAAAGSEMDALAVISDMNRHDKLITGSNMMLPKVSILDPTYTFTVPPKHTAAGSADIFSHICEPYFTVDESAYVSDRIAEALLKTVIHYAPAAMDDPTDYEARANLMWASSLAVNTLTAKGKDIGWSVHEIEHTISAYYDDVTHGVGLAVLTPVWMEYVLSEKTLPRFVTFGLNVWGIDAALPPIEIARLSIEKTRRFFSSLGLPETLRKAGVSEDKYFDEMAVKAYGPEGRANSFMPFSAEDVRNILQKSF